MPDANKLETLSNLGYRVLPTCGTCKHGRIRGGGWGTCDLQDYQHQKHTDTKKVSIFKSGSCPRFEISERDRSDLEASGFDIFLADELSS